MQTVEFTAEELEVVRDVVQHRLNEIEIEMFRTDTHDFKELLKHRKVVLEHFLNKIAIPAPV